MAFLEITFVDGNGTEFDFGANKTADFTSADAVDSWEFRITDGVFVPVEAAFIRAKAVFIQDQNAGGAAFVDNVTLENLSAIPEPSVLSLLTLGALGLVIRRNR